MEDTDNNHNNNSNSSSYWHDPLLLTDVSSQLLSHSISSSGFSSSQSQQMDHSAGESDVQHSMVIISPQRFNDLIKGETDTSRDGRSMLGFSLTSPDLVVCAGSPDILKAKRKTEDLADDETKGKRASVVLSLEEGIQAVEMEDSSEVRDSSGFSSFWRSSQDGGGQEEGSAGPVENEIPEGKELKDVEPVVSVNVGCEDDGVVLGGMEFLQDKCFSGGDVIRTDADVVGGDHDNLSLYKTARFGDFSYDFKLLERGKYVVDLHFAEIVFTDGPPGMRVFDVFIQDEKVVSGLDIYAHVGANTPLVIKNLETMVKDDGGLTIRLQGAIGNPIMCGISVKKVISMSCSKNESFGFLGTACLTDGESLKDIDQSSKIGDFKQLERDYEFQKNELLSARKAIEQLKKENQLRTDECQEAVKSLQELRNELMRKSMHVGSLAFAIEGQVKEKSKWFSVLSDLRRKLKILKLEHIKLSEEARKYQNCFGDMDNLRSALQEKILQQFAFQEELKKKVTEGEKERKELYNKVLDLKGNIRVFCRCRPLNTDELATGARVAVDFETARDGELTIRSNGWPKKTFKFDAVFGPDANQADVSEDTAPFATSVLDGYNVCIFAYGQTGTGKTFTMEGTEDARGVNYRTLAELFHLIDERQGLVKYEICVSVLEVYNEQIRDLLASAMQPSAATKRLEIRQASEGAQYIPGLVEAHVSNMSEVWDVLKAGSRARAVGSTNANEYSSRSHCLHCVLVKGENLITGECTKSKLWLVDLAGSERIAKSDAQGERLKEAQNINRSLSALGDVIFALANKSAHIPFRNSKLTHLLQDSLGGDSKALMFVQISPNENDLTETLCSLNFASRVKGIELGPARKQLDNAEFLRYKQLVEKTKQETKMKDVHIKKMEETFHLLEMKVKEKDRNNKSLQEKVKELEGQLLVERKLARQHVDTKLAEQQRQQLEGQNVAPLRPPLAAKPLGTLKNTCDLTSNASDPSNLLSDNSAIKVVLPFTVVDDFVSQNHFSEKENNPDVGDLPLQPKKSGRVSLCPTGQKIPITSTPRRNSLIPLPSTPMTAQLPSFISPMPPILADQQGEREDNEAPYFPELATCSPKAVKTGPKKLNGILRRSLQRRLKSPLQQQLRKGGINVGLEKVRVSIGSRGRMAQRIVHGAVRRGPTREFQQKQSQREKERGWNF